MMKQRTVLISPPDLRSFDGGFSLIEVLVALLVLGLGVIGFIALQLRSVETTSVTYARTQAMAVARDIIERININPQAWPEHYDDSNNKWTNQLAAPVGCMGSAAACDAAALAAADIYEVRAVVHDMLFNGKVVVEAKCNNQQIACVKVAWDQTTLTDCDPDDVSLEGAGEKGNCVIVEFWPQHAQLARLGGGV